METIRYELYQIGVDADCPFVYMGMDWLNDKGYAPEPLWYYRTAAGVIDDHGDIPVCEKLYRMYNVNIPRDYTGRSMSVSDVILLNRGGVVTAWYCDSIGFRLLSDDLGWKNVWGTAE